MSAVVLDKLGGERKPFLVLSEESTTDVVIAPTRPEEPEADETSAAPEAPILFAQGVAPAKPAAPKAQPTASKAQPKSSPAKPEKALTTAELLAAERAEKGASAQHRNLAADLLNPANACLAAVATRALRDGCQADGGQSAALSRCLWCCRAER